MSVASGMALSAFARDMGADSMIVGIGGLSMMALGALGLFIMWVRR